jgi:L-ribulose-5-phosphate 3-epimerase
MKKGINIWSFAENHSIETCMRIAKHSGYDGIELALSESGELHLETTEREALHYKRLANEIGIDITSLASGLYWQYSFTSANLDNRQKAYEIAVRQIELAAMLELDTVLIIPGAVGVDFITDHEVVAYDRAYELALEAVGRLAKVAEAHKVSIGLENVWNKFLLSPLEFRSFIDNINSDYLGAYLDVGNVIVNGYPEHWISILGRRIRKVHFKDYRRAAGGLHGFVDLLAGDVNYPEVVRHLRKIEYDDYVIAEMIPPYVHHTDQIIANTSAAMDVILGRRAALDEEEQV